jgi:hypothetical protein
MRSRSRFPSRYRNFPGATRDSGIPESPMSDPFSYGLWGRDFWAGLGISYLKSATPPGSGDWELFRKANSEECYQKGFRIALSPIDFKGIHQIPIVMTSLDYAPPLDRLLTYGDCNKMGRQAYPNYVAELGLTSEHVPDLIRMVTELFFIDLDEDRLEVWAPVHAWRSLGQLKAIEAFEPLLALLDQVPEDDYLSAELPKVLAAMGLPVLPLLTAHLQQTTHDHWTRIAIASAIKELAIAEPDHQDDCLAVITQQLEQYAHNSEELNASLIDTLAHFKVIDALPLIEKAFQAGIVDEDWCGTWARVQVEMGVRKESEFTEEELIPKGIREIREALKFRLPKASPVERGLPINWSARDTASSPRFGEGILSPKSPTVLPPKQGFGNSAAKGKSGKAKKKKK